MSLRRLFVVAVLLLPATAPAQSAWTIGRVNLPTARGGQSIAFGNGRFVATFNPERATPSVAWSVDGITWTPATTMISPTATVYFAAGAFYIAERGTLWRSVDGDAWQSQPIVSSLGVNGFASDGRSGLLGTSGVTPASPIYSPDLLTWTPTPPLPNATAAGHLLGVRDVGHIRGRYFVSYHAGSPGTNLIAYAATTVDGASWTPFPAFAGVSNFALGNNRLIGLRGSALLISTDGSTVFTRDNNPGVGEIPFLTHAGGRFFAGRFLLASFDGLTWAPLASVPGAATIFWRGVAYGNGRYVAVGTNQLTPDIDTHLDAIAVLQAIAPPIIAVQPASRIVAEGRPTTFAVTLENPSTTTTFQWRRNGTAIPGATLSSYRIPATSAAAAGRYTVEIRNPIGTTLSAPVTLDTVPPPLEGRLVNLSVLTSLDTPDATFTLGFVTSGAATAGTKPLLVRAAGPSLARFNVSQAHSDPKLELFAGPAKTGENDNWNGAHVDVSSQVGAFAFLSVDSSDAAFFAPAVSPGDSSVRVSSANASATGSVIAEVYDATPAHAVGLASPRLVNVSVLKPIATDSSLSAGFVLIGATPKTLLIRAIGPGLAAFNLPDSHADPRLALFRTGIATPIATNDDWAGSAALQSAFTAVGAFNLPVASRDAALLVTLNPGNYVAEARGAANTSGTALIEIYEVEVP